jgi:PAS domain S-box-containing protein
LLLARMTALVTPRRPTVPAWLLVLFVGGVTALVRLQVRGPTTAVMSILVGLFFAGVMLLRASRSRGRPRRAWGLFAVSVLVGSASTALYPWDAVGLVGPARGVLDVAAYVLGASGVVLFVRDFAGADPEAWLDAAAVGIAMSLVVFEVVLGPAWGTVVVGRPLAYSLAVAAIDAAAFTTLARFVVRPVASRTTALLGGIVALTLAFDAAYNTGSTPNVSRATFDAAWTLAYAAWAAGGLHPETPRNTIRPVAPLRPIRVEIRSTLGAVGLHAVALASVTLLLSYAIATGDAAGAPVLVLGLLALIAGAATRTVLVVRRLAEDVEGRFAAETALRQSEERFHRLAEVAPVGIFVSDANGRSVFQNEAWARANGVSPPAGLDLGYLDSVHPADRESALVRWFDSVRTRTPMSIDHRILRPDGSVAWVHADAVPLDDAAGRPAGWVGTVSDVTKLVEARTSAQEREAFFNELIEQSPVGIGVYGPDGSEFAINEAQLRIRSLAGASSEVVDVRADPLMVQLGQADAIAQAYAGEPADTNPGIVSLSLADGAMDDPHAPARGELALRMRWYPMRDTDGRILAVISFTEDVTEGVRAEAEHRRVEAKLQESAKLEALGVLAGGVAHDFNNLLVAILGHVEFARHDLPPGSPAVADLEAAETAAHRAADLARQMLAYSGRGSLATGPVDLEVLLREMGDLVAHSIAKGARLRHEFTPGLPPVLADVTQLRQLALNLIVNASDALEGHRGTITLRTGHVTLKADDPTLVAGTTAAPGDYVGLEVTDTGNGMDAATLSRIFDPFYSTKSVGRGLGLAATLGIVKGHGGAIRVISSPGAGTTFQVLLRPTEVPMREPGPQPAPAHERLEGRVLLVDDETTVRHVARRILQRAGYEVVEAADGPEALDQFMVSPDAFDAVVLDLTLPTMDGKAVLRDLRAIRPELPVVLCSGWSADEVADGLDAMRHIVFLQKPFTVRAMVDALVEVTLPIVEA